MNNLGIILLGVINTTSYHATNHQIAMYVLENLEKFDYLSEPELARACNVSKSSINRFFKELGYETFARFQADVLRFRRRHHFKYTLDDEDPRNPDATLFENYCMSVARNAELLCRNVDEALIAELAHDIDAYGQVIVMGEMQSGDVACAFQHNLFEAGRIVTASINSREQGEMLEHLEPDTLVVVFSLFGNLFWHTRPDRKPLEHVEGTKIYWITSHPHLHPEMPVDRIIDCQLGKNLAAGNLAMEIVANTVVLYYWQAHHDGRCDAESGGARTAAGGAEALPR